MEYNLYRADNFLYSLSVIDKNGNVNNKINSIIIYNNDGILLKTHVGFFDKDLKQGQGYVVKNGIIKKLKKKLDGSNFITNTECTYDTGYDLYIYYENIDYKYLGVSYHNGLYYQNYSIYGSDALEICVGCVNLKEKVTLKIESITKLLTSYNMMHNLDEFKNNVNKLNKLVSDFEKAEIKSKEIKVTDYKDFVYNDMQEVIDNNIKEYGDLLYVVQGE